MKIKLGSIFSFCEKKKGQKWGNRERLCFMGQRGNGRERGGGNDFVFAVHSRKKFLGFKPKIFPTGI
jgi:hypothetical protein